MIDAEERALMEATVRAAFADAVAAGDSADSVLEELGWRDMLRDEPADALAIVFDALGRAGATATALDDVLANALGLEPSDDVAILLPAFGSWRQPGNASDSVRAEGIATARAGGAREIVVVCGETAARVPRAEAEVRPLPGIDPDGGLHSVRIDARVEPTATLAPDAWPSAVALGQRAIAHQIEGACRSMLDLARTHALERTQFGGPIARFQAVRHRLAEALVAVESLGAALHAARDEPGPETAALAKALAGRAARTVSRQAGQVLAGIGFTTEHAFHRYLKRTMVLEGVLGSADAIALETGRRLLATRRVPTLIEL